MKAIVSVLVYREDGGFSDYVDRDMEIPRVPARGETVSFAGMQLQAWAVHQSWDESCKPIVICRVNPKEINRSWAIRKLLSCGMLCESRSRKPKR